MRCGRMAPGAEGVADGCRRYKIEQMCYFPPGDVGTSIDGGQGRGRQGLPRLPLRRIAGTACSGAGLACRGHPVLGLTGEREGGPETAAGS